MSDPALENAMVRRDELASEIDKLNQRLHDVRQDLKKVDAWIELWHAFAGMMNPLGKALSLREEHSQNIPKPASTEPVDSGGGDRTRTTGNPKKEAVAAAAIRIIEEAQEPVSRSDLFHGLADRGLVISGKDPEQVLSTMLWRAQQGGAPIIRLKRGGYWLADQPHEESGYDPDARDIEVPDEVRARHAQLSEKIADVDRLYYSGEDPNISDADYDNLRRELKEIEGLYPELSAENGSTAESETTATPLQIGPPSPLLDN